MNDYFQHLIDGITNQIPTIRPQFPSIFESPNIRTTAASDDLESEIVNRPREKAERSPTVRPQFPSAFTFPDMHDSTAVTDLEAKAMHHPQEKTGKETTAPVPPEMLSEKETFPEKLIRENASAKHIKDTKDMTSLPLQMQAVRIFSNETVNSALRKTALKSVRSEPASIDPPPSAVYDAGTNQQSVPQHLSADKVKKTVRRFFSTESGTRAADFRETRITPAGFEKQPKIRPLIAAEAASQVSPVFPPQESLPEKTIKVTIGRIEVRAVMPQAPLFRPQPEPKETQPKISLEDYLKKQRGGSR